MASAAKKANARAESKDARGKSATKSKKGGGLGARLGLRLITGRRKSDKSESDVEDETLLEVDNDVGQDSDAVEKYSLKTRFQAWWSGTELPELDGANDFDLDRGYSAAPESIFPKAKAAAESGLGGSALPPGDPIGFRRPDWYGVRDKLAPATRNISSTSSRSRPCHQTCRFSILAPG